MATPTLAEIKKMEQTLIDQGWTRMFSTFPVRVQEFINLYESTGHEVRVESWAVTENLDASCDNCTLIGIMRTIFTRKKLG